MANVNKMEAQRMVLNKSRKLARALAVMAAIVLVLIAPAHALAETVIDYKPQNNPVADNVTRLDVNKLEKGSREYVKGAHMAIIEKESGNVAADWTTDAATHTIEGQLNIGTVYILRELEAPEGYTKAKDTEFVLRSVDFNTKGEVITGPDAEFSEISGAGPQQAFVINLFDEATVTQEKVEHVKNERVITQNTTQTTQTPLAKTGDILNQPLIIGLTVGGLAIVAYGIYRKRKQQ